MYWAADVHHLREFAEQCLGRHRESLYAFGGGTDAASPAGPLTFN
jgi:hypothetical protein